MTNKNITFSVDSETYDKYSECRKKNWLVISKMFKIFMQKDLKEKGDKNESSDK